MITARLSEYCWLQGPTPSSRTIPAGVLWTRRFPTYLLTPRLIYACFFKSNVKTTLYLFDYLCMLKKQLYLHQKSIVLELLAQIPDFYLEMKWDFESSVVPWLGRLAPSGRPPFLYKTKECRHV